MAIMHGLVVECTLITKGLRHASRALGGHPVWGYRELGVALTRDVLT